MTQRSLRVGMILGIVILPPKTGIYPAPTAGTGMTI
jgi:hypothetical protein